MTPILGTGAAANAVNCPELVAIGDSAAGSMSNGPYATVVGNSAAQFFDGSSPNGGRYMTVFGPSAARQAQGNCEGATFLGLASGYFANGVSYSFIGGYASGRFAQDNTYSVLIGYACGEYSDRSQRCVMLGHHSGYRANDSENIVTIGRFAGGWADHSTDSVFVGFEAGGVEKMDAQTEVPSAHDVVRGVYIGRGAGKDSATTTDVVLIGTGTKADADVTNAIGLGKDAHCTVSNSMNVPVLARTGGGVLEVDAAGNVTPHETTVAALLATIAALTARIEALEGA